MFPNDLFKIKDMFEVLVAAMILTSNKFLRFFVLKYAGKKGLVKLQDAGLKSHHGL